MKGKGNRRGKRAGFPRLEATNRTPDRPLQNTVLGVTDPTCEEWKLDLAVEG